MDIPLWQLCFAWPALPFTILLSLVTLYWLLVIFGALGVDLLDVHLDGDVHLDHDFHLDPGLDAIDGHASLADWGMVGIRWFNLGDVPLMVWLTAFSLSAWLTSVCFDRGPGDRSTTEMALIVLRNFGIGLLAAKLLTQPLKGKLRHHEPNPVQELIGRRGVVSSLELSAQFGQVECADPAGAPLKLHARMDEGTLARGAAVEIVDYLPESKTFLVREVGQG